MFVVLRLCQFEFEPKESKGPAIEIDAGKMVGYLPVFETREDALTEYPGAEVRELRVVENSWRN